MGFSGINQFFVEGGIIERCELCGGEMKYTGIGEYVCKKCSHSMLNDYGKVRSYIEEHPGATQAEVSEATGVGKGKIKQLLREEKIEIADNSASFLRCESCGASIRSGYYCEACAKLAKTLQGRNEAHDRKAAIEGGYATPTTGASGAKRFNR